MTLLQLTIRLQNVGEGIDAGNRDFQFSPLDKLGEISQYRSAGRLNVTLGLDAILLDCRKVDDGIDAFWSDAKTQSEFDVIGTR